MRRRLDDYGHNAQTATLTPWALEEPGDPVPQDPDERRELFGSAKLGLLYSGSFGRAHIYAPFLSLARATRHLAIQTTFSVRGNREESLRAAITAEDKNIRITGFASPDHLEKRLAAADIHLVSLHEDWTGTVVPSKFFGALAVGRPVIFAGSPDSAVAQYIRQHKVGWVLGCDLTDILGELEALVAHPERLQALSAHCTQIYQQNFSKEKMCDAWDRHLRHLLETPRP
jgi:glycosyltransferase involved in cell wall biosynthesis